MNKLTRITAAALLMTAAGAAHADDWTIAITVDNQYDVYFGDNLTTSLHAGGDNNWTDVETYNAFGVGAGDYLYVSTASDYSVAQGFMGVFQNLTQGTTIATGDAAWEVFPAGKYLQSINPTWPAVWPSNLQPTQAEVDQAITFAETNNLWEATSGDPSWTNASHGGPWPTNLAGMPSYAQWIWHDAGVGTGTPYDDPYDGANHDEFLIFRVAGNAAPTPGAACLLGMAGLTFSRRRRA